MADDANGATKWRIVIVPRWAGGPTSDWYEWLTTELQRTAPAVVDEVVALDLPLPQAPVVAEWVAGVKSALGTEPDLWRRTILVAHSVGCQAALRAVAELAEAAGDVEPLRGLMAVAGWWAVDEPWPTLLPWQALDYDVARVRRAVAPGGVVVLLSDNDRFTRDFEQNARLWETRVGADVTIVPGANHFNGAREPAVLDALTRRFLV